MFQCDNGHKYEGNWANGMKEGFGEDSIVTNDEGVQYFEKYIGFFKNSKRVKTFLILN